MPCYSVRPYLGYLRLRLWCYIQLVSSQHGDSGTPDMPAQCLMFVHDVISYPEPDTHLLMKQKIDTAIVNMNYQREKVMQS